MMHTKPSIQKFVKYTNQGLKKSSENPLFGLNPKGR